jgi:outer membrane protein insertion porin family
MKGPEIVRGFQTSGIGPRDLNPLTTQDALGGSIYWGGTVEVLFPLSFIPKDFGLRAAIFADAGSLWNYTGVTTFPTLFATTAYVCPDGTAVGFGTPTKLCLADSGLIRSSVGASIIWASPFGPLRFDYAFALTKEPWDKLQAFRFGGMSRF